MWQGLFDNVLSFFIKNMNIPQNPKIEISNIRISGYFKYLNVRIDRVVRRWCNTEEKWSMCVTLESICIDKLIQKIVRNKKSISDNFYNPKHFCIAQTPTSTQPFTENKTIIV